VKDWRVSGVGPSRGRERDAGRYVGGWRWRRVAPAGGNIRGANLAVTAAPHPPPVEAAERPPPPNRLPLFRRLVLPIDLAWPHVEKTKASA
jgi:hypothetical protein